MYCLKKSSEISETGLYEKSKDSWGTSMQDSSWLALDDLCLQELVVNI